MEECLAILFSQQVEMSVLINGYGVDQLVATVL
jgi:hypothetical protein